MRVLVVSHYFPPHLGGIENVAHGQAVRLAAAGHDVTVVTSSPGAAAGTRRTAEGVLVHRVRTWNGIEQRAGVPFPVFGPGLLVALWSAVRAADVVHVHDSLYASSWLAALLARLLRRPLVLTQHVDLVQHPNPAVRFAQRLVYATGGLLVLRTARAVLVLNGRVRGFVLARGVRPERVALLPNAVDTDRFRPAEAGERAAARASFGLPTSGRIVLFVGRFVPKKGYDLLLAAAQDRDWSVALAGGPAPSAAPDPRRHYLGALPPDRLAQLYRAADAFALPSEGEGFPLTAQEAMASGLPVLLGDDPGYAVYELDPTLVRLVERTPEAVGKALDEIVDDASLHRAMGTYARRTCVERFGWAAHLSALTAVYRSAVAGREAVR